MDTTHETVLDRMPAEFDTAFWQGLNAASPHRSMSVKLGGEISSGVHWT